LPPGRKELLRTLAVIGKDPTLELLKQVTGKHEEQLEPMLSDLQMSEFIYEQPSIGGAAYTFKHALTQEVAYNSLLAERRRIIHEQTARAIEVIYAGQLDDHYSELARHHLRGSDAAKAVQYARLAAEQAVSRVAYPEATSLIEGALKLLDRLANDTERWYAELALRNIESMVAFASKGPASPERERAIRRMCQLGEEIGQADQLLPGLLALGALYFLRGEPVRGLEVSARCLELAETTQDAGLRADVGYAAGLMALFVGNLREAASHLEDAAFYSSRTNRRVSNFGLLYGSSIPCLLASTLQLFGRVSEAARLNEEGLRHARESQHLFSLGHALAIGALVPHYRREPEVARVHTEEAIALCEENGFALWLLFGRVLHGWALAELGQLEQGIADMEAAIAGVQRMGRALRQHYFIALLAQAYARMGKTEKALAMLSEALEQAERTTEKTDYEEMLRLKGELLLMRDGAASEEAEACFRKALEVARAQATKWWELRTSVSLARLLHATNRRDEACTLLGDIYGWFTEGFDTADLKDAKALLDELSA
jgi:tetratricopeptide (TPR) repeat protein